MNLHGGDYNHYSDRVYRCKACSGLRCFCESSKHREFTGAAATGEAKEGAEYTAWDGYINGKHLELVRARKIVDEWRTSEWPEGFAPSRLEFRFADKDGGTEVTMVHSEVPESQAEAYRQGWVDYYWNPLKEYFD